MRFHSSVGLNACNMPQSEQNHITPFRLVTWINLTLTHDKNNLLGFIKIICGVTCAIVHKCPQELKKEQ